MKFNIVLLPLLASLSTAYIGEICFDGDYAGTCETTAWCSSNHGTSNVKNLCPNDPVNVRCCFYPNCNGHSGKCDVIGDLGCVGSYVAGHCPGNSDYECCTDCPTCVGP